MLLGAFISFSNTTLTSTGRALQRQLRLWNLAASCVCRARCDFSASRGAAKSAPHSPRPTHNNSAFTHRMSSSPTNTMLAEHRNIPYVAADPLQEFDIYVPERRNALDTRPPPLICNLPQRRQGTTCWACSKTSCTYQLPRGRLQLPSYHRLHTHSPSSERRGFAGVLALPLDLVWSAYIRAYAAI